jgi:hypothetical protein
MVTRQSLKWLNAFGVGLKKHGLDVVYGHNHPLPVDLSVTWSAKKHKINKAMADRGKDVLVLEHGYFGDRENVFCSCGFNGLNGRAEFLMPIVKPRDRWEKHKDAAEVKPWRTTPGEYVLLLGQVAGDASVQNLPPTWYGEIAAKARGVFGLPVVFRPHPKARATTTVDGTETRLGGLQDAFKNAHCAITWNSNSGVDAVLAGVPTFTFDEGSMAWAVTLHKLSEDLHRPDRDIWLRHLAYCQWTVEELESGEAWEFLRTKYEFKTRHAASV